MPHVALVAHYIDIWTNEFKALKSVKSLIKTI